MAILVDDCARPHGGLIRTLTIARPERRNALDHAHFRLLAEAIAEAARIDAVRVLVVTGQGTAFCAGYDLSTPLNPDAATAPDAIVLQTMTSVRACPIPIIARVNGPAFGAGLELAISCDLRVVSDQSTFCLPPARLGIAYAPEGLARLVSLIGTGAARRMVFSCEVVPADRALALGLVEELAPAALLDERTIALADTIADAAPLAVAAMKRTFNRLELALPPNHREEAERDRLACYASDDAAEGAAAFVSRRPPVFRKR